MNFKAIIFNVWPLLVFLVLVIFMFFPEFQGKTLERGDAIQSQAKMKGLLDYRSNDNENYIWNPGQFSGMPMLYGAPSENNLLVYADKVLKLGLPRPMSIFFLALLSAFLLGRLGLRMDNLTAILLAVAMVLPLTNLILWKAGHVSKIEVLSYTPLLILGVLLIFEQSKYLLGFLIFSFAMAMSLYMRHPQMTYYVFMVFLIYGIAKSIQVIRSGTNYKGLFIGAGLLIMAVVLGIGSSSTKIWSMKVHSEESMRGAPILKQDIVNSNSSSSVDGLNWEYAMQWSNGWSDLVATFIPGFNGGGSGQKVSTSSESFQKYKMRNAPLYWGNLPFTEAPLYLGLLNVFMFLFASIYYKGHLKWWLVGGVLLTLMISMGNVLNGFNRFIFDVFPYYNKFRTPQSILSVTPYFMTVLGVLGIHEFFKNGDSKHFRKSLIFSGGVMACFSLLTLLVFPSMLSFEATSDSRYAQQGVDISVFINDRKSLMKSDALRSLFLISAICGVLMAYAKEKISSSIGLMLIIGLVAIDLLLVNNRYLSFDDYKSKRKVANIHQPRAVDQQILSAEKLRYDYRVLDQTINTYSAANTSYFHNTLGGYDPVKLQRYADIIDAYLLKGNMGVLNMLNTKYFILNGDDGQPIVQQNPNAFGVAWFVSNILEVSSPDEEFKSLGEVDLSKVAIVNKSEFSTNLSATSYGSEGALTIKEYTPDRIVYSSSNPDIGFAVFSEIWFNGESWIVSIDGQETNLIRTNYLLRGAEIPAGSHEIKFEFVPSSVIIGEKITLASSLILMLLFLGFGGVFIYQKVSNAPQEEAYETKQVKKKIKRKKK